MWSLIWRNEAWRSCLKLGLTAVSTSTLLLALYHHQLARGQQPMLDVALLALWLNAAIFLLLPQAGRRCSEFDLALPIPSGRLWRAHLASVMLATFTILAVGLAVFLGCGTLLASLTLRYNHTLTDAIRFVPSAITSLILAVVATLALRPHLHRIPNDRRTVIAKLAILAVGAGLTWTLEQLPWYASCVPLVVAMAIGVHTLKILPSTLSLLSSTPKSAGRPIPGVAAQTGDAATGLAVGPALNSSAWGHGSSFGFRLRLAAMILQAVSKGPVVYIVTMPLAFAFGALLSGFGELYWFDDELRFSFVPITAYLLLAFTGTPLGKFAVLDYLPIPRRTVFAILMLPQILTIVLGYGIGYIFVTLKPDSAPTILCCVDEDKCQVLVPLSYFEFAGGGAPAVIEAPWGETVEPKTLPIWRHSRAVLYKPYTTSPENSPEFVAWQISRAVQAVYGETIDPAEIQRRYLALAGEGPPVVEDRVRAMLADHPDWKPRSDGPVFPVLMLLVGLIFLPALWIYLGRFRATVSDASRKRTFWGLMILFLSLHMSQYFLALNKIVNLDAVTGLWHILIRQLASPLGTVAVWGAVAAILGLGYVVVLRRFQKIEAISSCDMCL